MGRKIHHPVVVERRALHHSFTGLAAEVDVAGRRTELAGNRLEFVGSVEKRRQIAGELGPVDARSLPELAVAAGHGNAGVGSAAFGQRATWRKALRLASTGRTLTACRLMSQAAFPIGGDVRELRNCSGWLLGHQQVKRQRGQRAGRHDQQMTRLLSHLLDRSDQGR
jgi:hypothetical protein